MTSEKINQLITRIYDEQKSDAWLKLRGNMLTASDVASVLGLNPYETPDDVMYKKCGFRKRGDYSATEHGNRYESEARDVYCKLYNETVHEIGVVPHPKYPWLGGSPDGITDSEKLIEIKCPVTRKITNEVPKHYIPQVQLLMEVLDLETCDFIQYRPSPYEFVVTKVDRDRLWFERSLPIMEEFWKNVLERRKKPLCEIVDNEVLKLQKEARHDDVQVL